jgi:dipeptidyl aminopeptidase/acylaminoacyl peptidase
MINFRALSLCISYVLILLSSFQIFAQPISTSATGQENIPVPVEVFGALPGVKTIRLSPDGRSLAMIMPVKGRNSMVIWDLSGNNKPKAISTGELEPEWLVWKSDKRLIAGLRYFSLRDPQHPTADTRLIALDADGSNQIAIVGKEWFESYVPQIQDKIVGFLPDDENHILIELPAIERSRLKSEKLSSSSIYYGNLDDKIKYPEVVRVDVYSGQMVTVAHQQGNVVHWLADAAGNIRLGVSLDGKMQGYQVRNSTNDSWRTLHPFEINKGRVFKPVAFVDGKPDRLFALSNHDGKTALYEFDIPTESFVRTVAANTNGSVEPIVRDARLLGYNLPSKVSPVYLDAAYARDAQLINGALPDSRNTIVDRSADGKRTLIKVVKGNEPPSFWLLDQAGDKPALGPVAETYPGLTPAQIANSRQVTYKARDGLVIPATLTLPVGVAFPLKSPLPFVVLPHGGPTSNDVSGFDYLVQFLASRGYGVFQPQFRGSTGFGASFETAGYQQWGLAMQDDLTDGTRWLIQQKYAAPGHIAIVGASYGGYAALMGVVKEPDLYCCAIAIAPVTDLELLIENLEHFAFGDLNVPRIGTDVGVLRKTSPARNAEHIRVPLLLVHGRKDYTVSVAHTEIMVSALRKAGKKAEVLFLDEADHFLSRGDDRIATLKAMEEFLVANFPAPE